MTAKLSRPAARLGAAIAVFGKCRRAITTLELSLLALPFFTIFFAIIETGYVFFLAILLEGATADAARQIRTGVVQEAGSPLARFQEILCDRLFGMIPCPQALVIDVRNYSRFEDANPPAMPATQQGSTFVAGNPGDVIVVRVSYSWHFITPFLDQALGDDGARAFIASAAFRNEPWGGPL